MDHSLILFVPNSIHCAEGFAITSMSFEQECIRKWFSRVKIPLLEKGVAVLERLVGMIGQ
jgi:hypothetical protein